MIRVASSEKKVMDMATSFLRLHVRSRYTGNNRQITNHPSSFGHRLFAPSPASMLPFACTGYEQPRISPGSNPAVMTSLPSPASLTSQRIYHQHKFWTKSNHNITHYPYLNPLYKMSPSLMIMVDVLKFIWRVPSAIIGFRKKEHQILDMIEDNVDEIANAIETTAKGVENVAEGVENIANVIKKDARVVEDVMEKVKEQVKFVHDTLEGGDGKSKS